MYYDRSGFDAPSALSAAPPVRAARAHAARSRVKRLADLVVAGAALALLSPLMALIAVLVRLESPGPAFFRQRRGGLGGRTFVIYKFRTMRVEEDDDHALRHAARGDPRITGLGGVLRRLSLDELPQLINVVKGDMSLVGPRPHALAHDRHYAALVPDYGFRAQVRPGLTGLAQVSGHRGEIDTPRAMMRRVALDRRYIETWTPLLDLRLMALTLVRLPFDERAR